MTAAHTIDVPPQIGPAEISTLGNLIAIRAPRELDAIFRRAGGQWEPGSRRWLIERRRIGPVIRALREATDGLFRSAGVPARRLIAARACRGSGIAAVRRRSSSRRDRFVIWMILIRADWSASTLHPGTNRPTLL